MKGLAIIYLLAALTGITTIQYINHEIDELVVHNTLQSITLTQVQDTLTVSHDLYVDMGDPVKYGKLQPVALSNWRYYREEYKGRPLEVIIW